MPNVGFNIDENYMGQCGSDVCPRECTLLQTAGLLIKLSTSRRKPGAPCRQAGFQRGGTALGMPSSFCNRTNQRTPSSEKSEQRRARGQDITSKGPPSGKRVVTLRTLYPNAGKRRLTQRSLNVSVCVCSCQKAHQFNPCFAGWVQKSKTFSTTFHQ